MEPAGSTVNGSSGRDERYITLTYSRENLAQSMIGFEIKDGANIWKRYYTKAETEDFCQFYDKIFTQVRERRTLGVSIQPNPARTPNATGTPTNPNPAPAPPGGGLVTPAPAPGGGGSP